MEVGNFSINNNSGSFKSIEITWGDNKLTIPSHDGAVNFVRPGDHKIAEGTNISVELSNNRYTLVYKASGREVSFMIQPNGNVEIR